MNRLAIVLAVMATPALAQEPYPNTQDAVTYHRREATWDPAWFICDGLNRPVVHVMGGLDARAGVTLWTYAKAGFRTSRTAYIAGNPDAGMSQINVPLFPYPRGDRSVGAFRVLAPGVASDMAGATTGAFSSVTVGKATTSCRWLPGTRLQMFGANRSVYVTQEGGAYVYRSFDYKAPTRLTADGRSSAPSLTLRGGRLVRGTRGIETGHDVYVFTNRGYTYRATVSSDPANPGAGLSVYRGGRMIAVDTAAAYTFAARR